MTVTLTSVPFPAPEGLASSTPVFVEVVFPTQIRHFKKTTLTTICIQSCRTVESGIFGDLESKLVESGLFWRTGVGVAKFSEAGVGVAEKRHDAAALQLIDSDSCI